MDDDALIEAVAAAIAPSYAELDRSGWIGLMLYPYPGTLSAVVWGMRDLDPPLGIDAGTMDALGMPEGMGEAWETLLARVEDDEAWDLEERYQLALARHVHALIGQPVIVHESRLMPMEEQLARQGGRDGVVASPLLGLKVIVSARVDEHRVAAVWRGAEGDVSGSGSVGLGEEVAVGRWAELGADPVVLAGELPPGAVGVSVSVEGDWLAPEVRQGYWICVTGARLLRRDPELVYRDVEGAAFAHAVPFDGPGVPTLWPMQAPAQAVPTGRSDEPLESVQLDVGGWRVHVFDQTAFAPAAVLVAHALGVPEWQVRARPIPGSVLGRPHGFELAAQGDVWAAVAECGGFSVTIEAEGAPPARLDLVPVAGRPEGGPPRNIRRG